MAIRIDPVVSAAIPRELLQESSGVSDVAVRPHQVAAMDRPAGLVAQTAPSTKPQPSGGERSLSKIEQEAVRLRAALKAGGAGAVLAAREALALASSYAMRRSRGARRHALDLCEQVAASVPERADHATKLQHVLLAEAYLHQNDAASALRAVRALMLMLSDGEGSVDAGA